MKTPKLILSCLGFLALVSCSVADSDVADDDGSEIPSRFAAETLAFSAIQARDVSLSASGSCAALDARLQKLAQAQLEQYWQQTAQNCYSGFDEDVVSMPEDDIASLGEKAASTPTDAAMTATLDYTEQNSQIQGVLEPDVVFTNGELIFVLSEQREIKIYQAWPAEDLAVLSVIDTTTPIGAYQFAYLNKMILADSHLTVFGSFFDATGYFEAQVVFDVSDPRVPQAVSAAFVKNAVWRDARWQDGRLISVFAQSLGLPVQYGVSDATAEMCAERGGTLQMTAAYKEAVVAHLESEGERLQTLTIAEQLPQITTLDLQNNTTTTQTLDCADVLVNDFTVGNDLTLVLQQSPAASDVQAFAVLGNANTVYMNAQSLLLAAGTTPLFYEILSDDQIDITTTVLHRFALVNESLVYQASGIVPGTVPSAFAIDNDGAVTRVATQVLARGEDQPIDVALHVLAESDGAMAIVGKLTDLVRDEQIFSARYVGDRLYLVTYQVVINHDPLFVIDISDDADPRLLGQMSLTGFSSYLQKIADARLLGIGQTDTDCWWGGCWGQDYKISLFDVSDEAVPTEVSQLVLPVPGAEAHIDHLSVHYDEGSQKLFLPLLTRYTADTFEPQYELSIMNVADAALVETGRVAVAGSAGEVLRTVLIGDATAPLLYIVGNEGIEVLADF